MKPPVFAVTFFTLMTFYVSAFSQETPKPALAAEQAAAPMFRAGATYDVFGSGYVDGKPVKFQHTLRIHKVNGDRIEGLAVTTMGPASCRGVEQPFVGTQSAASASMQAPAHGGCADRKWQLSKDKDGKIVATYEARFGKFNIQVAENN